MQKDLPKIYLFIDSFNSEELLGLNKNIAIIFRNYKKKIEQSTLISIKNLCKKQKRNLYLAGDIKMAIKLKLNGVYIPSFNKKINTQLLSLPKNFKILGSAHNKYEIVIKEKQGCDLIFIAPVFKVDKKRDYLGISKFNLLTLSIKNKIIALGGINEKNFRKIKLLNCRGIAGISWVKKNGLRNLGRF